jgi:hypothetical protein
LNFAAAASQAADKIPLQLKHLTRMPGDYAISLTRLRPNGGHATAKLRREARLFDLISIKLKYLHVMLANLSVLRRRCDEPKAKWGHRTWRLTSHAAASGFCAAAGWLAMVSRRQRMP